MVGIGSACLVLPCVVVVVGRGAMVDVVGLGVLVVVFPAWRSSFEVELQRKVVAPVVGMVVGGGFVVQSGLLGHVVGWCWGGHARMIVRG